MENLLSMPGASHAQSREQGADKRWREVKAQALDHFTAASPMLARLAKEELVKRFERELPSATACSWMTSKLASRICVCPSHIAA